METYIPDEDFVKCADLLAPAELKASVTAALFICGTVHETLSTSVRSQVARHPTLTMWGKHIPVLIGYALQLNERRIELAHSDGEEALRVRTTQKLEEHLSWATSGEYTLDHPRWLGEYSFHMSQRAMLMRLDPVYYGPKWPGVQMDTTQYWPVA